jgi:hypothetical protein
MPSSCRQKVHDHRQRLRAQGLRPIQVWVPDTRSRSFAAAAAAQARAVATSDFAVDDQAFVDSVSAPLPG